MFTKLIELFPELVFDAEGVCLLDDGMYDVISELAHEVPYLLRAYIQAKGKIMKLEDTYERDQLMRNLVNECDSYKERLKFAEARFNKMVKAMQQA